MTPWTGVCQAPLSMGFPRQEYFSGLPFPSSGDLPDTGVYVPLLPLLSWMFLLDFYPSDTLEAPSDSYLLGQFV